MTHIKLKCSKCGKEGLFHLGAELPSKDTVCKDCFKKTIKEYRK